MLGRMIPAETVQDHLRMIINTIRGTSALTPTEIAVVAAGEDMGLLTIEHRDAQGVPNRIAWTKL